MPSVYQATARALNFYPTNEFQQTRYVIRTPTQEKRDESKAKRLTNVVWMAIDVEFRHRRLLVAMTVRLFTTDEGYICVVTDADDNILIDKELWEAVTNKATKTDPMHNYKGSGTIEDDKYISFGVDGMGLGRLTYERIGIEGDYITCRRYVPEVKPDDSNTES